MDEKTKRYLAWFKKYKAIGYNDQDAEQQAKDAVDAQLANANEKEY